MSKGLFEWKLFVYKLMMGKMIKSFKNCNDEINVNGKIFLNMCGIL